MGLTAKHQSALDSSRSVLLVCSKQVHLGQRMSGSDRCPWRAMKVGAEGAVSMAGLPFSLFKLHHVGLPGLWHHYVEGSMADRSGRGD